MGTASHLADSCSVGAVNLFLQCILLVFFCLFTFPGVGGVTVTADIPPTQTYSPMIHHQGSPSAHTHTGLGGVGVGHQRSSPPPNFQNLSMIKEDSLDSNHSGSGGTDLSPKDPLPPLSSVVPPAVLTEEELQKRRDRRRSSGSTDDGEGGSKRKQYPQISITDTHGHEVQVPSTEDTSVTTDELVVHGAEFTDLEGVEDESQVLKDDDLDISDRTTKPAEGYSMVPGSGVTMVPGITSGSPIFNQQSLPPNPASGAPGYFQQQ